MKHTKTLTKYQHHFKNVPHKYWIIGGVLLSLVLVYSLIFFIPKKVDFSYAGETCVRQLVLFPTLQTAQSDSFDIKVKDELKIGNLSYASTQVCATPKEAPAGGTYAASIGLSGGWLASKQFSIDVKAPPVALTNEITGKKISAALPLRIKLTSTDTIHQYKLAVASKTSDCTSEDNQLVCDVADLKLSPGAEYALELTRSYNGENATQLAKADIGTLQPIVPGEASLTEGKTLYDTPKEFAFKFDQSLDEADVTLLQKGEGDATAKLETTTRLEDNTLYVTVAKDLARKTNFNLTLNQVIAQNGSSLEAPIAINFSTSGGPKPSNVSVGTTGVAQNAQIVVTLDQPIKDDVDIAQFTRVTGVNGSVTKRSPTELVFSIQGGLCQTFSLVFDKGIASATNSEVSEAWKFDSRVICGTSTVIGHSVKGRAIIAYYFGSGNETILFTGGIHGSERSGQQTMQAFADYLMNNAAEVIPANRRIVVVPNTNPDAIAVNSRNNVNNVNVDRNFPASNWQADIETASGLIKNGGGTAPGSEPEARALIDLTRQLRPMLSISYHAQGRLVGANQVGISINAGNIYSSTVGYGTMYGNAEEVMGYAITGEYEDWMGQELGVAAILIELPTPNGNYFNSQLPAIRKMLTL